MALHAMTEARSTPSRSTNPALQNYQSKARWAKPMPKQHANFIPAQSWLGYNWIDRDPELDFVLHAIEESGWTLERIEAETEKNGHKVSRHTLLAWFYKGTRQPKNVTMNNVMAAIGWHRHWTQQS
jgi:hypothetical protein